MATNDNQPIEKWCENCGATNDIVAQFCKNCGHQFPEIADFNYQERRTQMNQPPAKEPQTSTPDELDELKPPSYIPEGQAPFKQPSTQQSPQQGFGAPVPLDGEAPLAQDVSETKYCPNCGYGNKHSDRFCNNCGTDISHLAEGPVKPQYQQPIQQTTQPPPQYQQPQSYAQPPPYQQPPTYGQQTGPIVYQLRSFEGKGLLDATNKILRNPAKTTPELLEDQTAPGSRIFVLIFALLNASLVYMKSVKTEYIEVNVDSSLESQYTTDEGIRELALLNGIGAFLLVFVGWFVGSFIIGLMIRGGLPMNSYVKYNPSQSMRQLGGFRYVPYIVVLIIQIILLNFEDKRQSRVEGDGTFGQPLPSVINDFSSTYVNISLVLTIASGIFSAYIFRKGVKDGLFHQGISPLLIGIGIVIANLNRDLTV